VKCPYCGANLVEVRQGNQVVYYCDNDGYTKVEQSNKTVEVPPTGKVCTLCGTLNRQVANFCKYCGERLT